MTTLWLWWFKFSFSSEFDIPNYLILNIEVLKCEDEGFRYKSTGIKNIEL